MFRSVREWCRRNPQVAALAIIALLFLLVLIVCQIRLLTLAARIDDLVRENGELRREVEALRLRLKQER